LTPPISFRFALEFAQRLSPGLTSSLIVLPGGQRLDTADQNFVRLVGRWLSEPEQSNASSSYYGTEVGFGWLPERKEGLVCG
jgi:hypothetical protein